jgi:hypothetical protein
MAKRMAFQNPAVAAVFAAYPEPDHGKLMALRQLIFETAAATEGVGPLEEALKWGQPSYLTPTSKSGSTIRIDRAKSGGQAIFFHCQTNLVETFRAHYAGQLRFAGNRAIEFRDTDPLPEAALRHCIALALTYHARRRAAVSAA